MPTLEELGIDRLPPEEQAALAEAIWENLNRLDADIGLTNEQIDELERRIAAADANPGSGKPWEQVNADLHAKMR